VDDTPVKKKKPRARKRPRSELKVKFAKPAKPAKLKERKISKLAKNIVNDGDNLDIFSFRGKNSKIRDGGVVTYVTKTKLSHSTFV
jgi:predicted ribonuclease toxin of YeeF-YezG toxin-antitoxin module